MLRRFLSFGAVGTVLLLSIPAAASAHVLRTDHGISAELHVNPHDHPIAGKKASYIISFTNEPPGFKLDGYAVTVSIIDTMDPGKVIARQTITQTSPGESRNSFTFQMAMDYTLTVTGTPKEGSANLPAFSLTYPIHVQAAAAKNDAVNPILWAAIGGGIAAIIIAAVIMERGSAKAR